MERYKIPKIYMPGFEILLKLDEKNFRKLINLLKKMPVGMGPKSFFAYLIKEIKIENANYLASTIYGLGELLISDVGNLKELAEDITTSFKKQCKTKPTLKMLKDIKLRLVRLFVNCENLKITFKALNLCTDNERIFQNCRIITDIRLIFKEDIEDVDRNAIVIHNLKIGNLKDDETNDIFISFDSNGLLKLKEQIERAIQKEAQIKNNYKETVNFIDLTD